MRVISLPVAFLLVLLSSAVLAQQSPGTVPTPQASDPSPQVTGAVPTAPLRDPLATGETGPGLNVSGSDGSTKTVKSIPCSASAQETDGSTTCVGIPERR